MRREIKNWTRLALTKQRTSHATSKHSLQLCQAYTASSYATRSRNQSTTLFALLLEEKLKFRTLNFETRANKEGLATQTTARKASNLRENASKSALKADLLQSKCARIYLRPQFELRKCFVVVRLANKPQTKAFCWRDSRAANNAATKLNLNSNLNLNLNLNLLASNCDCSNRSRALGINECGCGKLPVFGCLAETRAKLASAESVSLNLHFAARNKSLLSQNAAQTKQAQTNSICVETFRRPAKAARKIIAESKSSLRLLD